MVSALFALLLQYQIFIPMVNKVLVRHRINHQRYDVLICRIVKVSCALFLLSSPLIIFLNWYS